MRRPQTLFSRTISASPSLPAVLAALCLALGACQGSGVQEETDAGSLRRLRAEPDMRIGSFQDPDLGFSRIGGVDVDREGNIYVVEMSVPEIRVFSPEGQLLRRIGGRGGGPGEFEGTPRFGVVGDTIWAWDGRISRITLFDRQGHVLSTGRTDGVRVHLPRSIGSVLPHAMRPDGTFTSFFSRISSASGAPESGVEPTDSIPFPMVLFDASGAVIDTIGWAGRPPPRIWRPPSERGARPEIVTIDGQRLWVPSPPPNLPWWLPVMDGYVVVEAPPPESEAESEFTVIRMGLRGDTIYSRDIRYEPVPYTAEDLDSIAARGARGEPGGGVPYRPGAPAPPNWETIARTFRAHMDYPEFQAPLDYPWLAQDESVWIRLNSEEGAPSRWIVLDPRGRPRGALELPPDLRVRWSRGDTLWAVDLDEYEVQWLVRYRIQGA